MASHPRSVQCQQNARIGIQEFKKNALFIKMRKFDCQIINYDAMTMTNFLLFFFYSFFYYSVDLPLGFSLSASLSASLSISLLALSDFSTKDMQRHPRMCPLSSIEKRRKEHKQKKWMRLCVSMCVYLRRSVWRRRERDKNVKLFS